MTIRNAVLAIAIAAAATTAPALGQVHPVMPPPAPPVVPPMPAPPLQMTPTVPGPMIVVPPPPPKFEPLPEAHAPECTNEKRLRNEC